MNWNLIGKSVAITGYAFAGSCVMFIPHWDLVAGFVVWIGVMLGLLAIGVRWHMFDDANQLVYFVVLCNGVAINFGLYLGILILLRVPLAGVDYLL